MKKRILTLFFSLGLLCGCGNSLDGIAVNEVSSAPAVSSVTSIPESTVSSAVSSAPKSTASAISSMTSSESVPEYTVTQDDIVFVDYKLIENYEGITDESLVAEQSAKAKEALKNLDEYEETSNEISFKLAFIEDFDGDSKEETLIFLRYPTRYGYDFNNIAVFSITDDIADYCCSYEIFGELDVFSLLDYGCCKHLYHYYCYNGVDNDGSLLIFDNKNAGSVGCFSIPEAISKHGPFFTVEANFRRTPSYCFFDAKTKQYFSAEPQKITKEEFLALDKTDSLKNLEKYDVIFSEENSHRTRFGRMNDKYYTINVGDEIMARSALFLVLSYENGTFTLDANSPIREYTADFPLIPELDYDKAMSSMISVEEARAYS